MKHYSTIILFLLSMLMFVPGFVFADLTLTDVSISPSSPTTTNTLSGTFTGSYTNVSYAWNTDNGSIQFFCSWNAQSDDCGDYYNFTSTGTTNYTINDFYGTYGLTADASSDEWDGVNNAEVFNDDNFAYVFTIKHDIVSTDQQYYKKGHTGAPYENGYGRLDNQGANAYLHFRTQDSVPVSNNLYSTTAIVANTWYHVAFVKCGNTKYIYLDGVEDNAATVMTGIYDADGDFRIFRDNGFDGTMGEFRYYDRCITPTEVLNLYHNNPIFNFTDTSVGMNITLTAKADNGTSFTAWVSDSVTITSAISEPQVSSVTITGNQSTPGAHLDGSIVASDYTELHTWWNTPDGSLVAYYPFSNESATDITGNGNDGAVTGATYSSALGAYTFDGSSDYITIPNLSVDYSDFSFSVWINTSDTNNQENIFSHGRDAYADSDNGFELHYYLGGTDDKLQATIYQDGTRVYLNYFPAGYADGDMHHIVVTGTNGGQSLWVNGVEVATDNELFTTFTVSSNAYLGAGLVNNNNWVGTIDNFQIYERVLTDEEIKELYLQQAQYKDRILYMPFDDSIDDRSRHQAVTDGVDYSITTEGLLIDTGIGNYVNASIELSNNNISTVSMWLNNTGDTRTWSDSFAFNNGVRIEKGGSNTLYFLGGACDWVEVTNDYELGWNHIVVRFNSSHCTSYKNGVQHGLGTIVSTVAPDDVVYIGSRDNNEHAWNNTIDDVLIYDRALSSEEIKRMYDQSCYEKGVCSTDQNYTYINATATTSEGEYICYAVASDLNSYSALSSDSVSLSEASGETETYERYIDATLGSDSNNGTDSSHPWQTISKLNSSTIPDGTKIYFKAGEVWQEGLAITENNILIGRYGAGDAPYLNGSQSWTRGTIHVTGDNITIQNINLGYGGQETLEFDAVIGISLFNITIDHSYDKTIDIDDSFNAWIENVHLIDSGLKNPIAGAQGEGFWFQDSVNITIKGSSTLRHGGVNFNGFNSRNIFLTNLSAIDANPDNNPYDGLPAYYFDNCSDVIITNVYARNTTLGLSFNAENSSGNNGLAWNMTAINVTCYEVGTCLWIGSNMAGPGPYLHDVSVDRVSIFRETYYRGPVNGYGQDVYVEEVDGFSLTNLLLIQQNDSNTKEIVKFFNDSVTDWVWDNNSYNYTAPFKWQFQSSYGSLLSTWQAKGIDVNSASTDVYFYNKTAVILYDNSSACSFHGAGSEVGASECVTAAGGCIASWSNTSWSSWSDNGTCLTDDNQPQVRSLVQYDTNLCPLSVNVTHYGYQNVSCNYCSYSLVYGSWSNVTCGWRQHNDSVWSSCCSVTGLIADCYSSDNQSVQYNYNETAVCAASSTPTAVCSSVQDMFAVTGAFFSVLIIALLGFTAVHLFKKGQINLSYLAVGGALLVGVGAALLFGSAFVGAVCLTL